MERQQRQRTNSDALAVAQNTGKGGKSQSAVPVLQQKITDEPEKTEDQISDAARLNQLTKDSLKDVRPFKVEGSTAQKIAVQQTPVTPFQLIAQQRFSNNESRQQRAFQPVQRKNDTGLPDHLKTGVETLSGFSMDDVKVHFNSAKPAQLQAFAYAQGSEIHVGPGQEQHLPHEAWHVVQQKQGRVQPTVQMKGSIPVNDDAGLENEADVMGAKALQLHSDNNSGYLENNPTKNSNSGSSGQVLQGAFVYSFIHNNITDSPKSDEYYENIGFIRVLNPGGGYVWADRRNVENVKDLLNAGGPADTEQKSEIEAFTISAPTHDKTWQSTISFESRLECIHEALDIIDSGYDPSRLYILSAPEYFFAAQSKDSHFMSKEEFNQISAGLQSIASSLPSNIVMVPGTIGYSETISGKELKKEVAQLREKHKDLLNYVDTYKHASTEENEAIYKKAYVEQDYKFDWDDEIEQIDDQESARKLFNKALVFYNNTMETYDKMFESVSGETDKSKGDRKSVFTHGTKPFVREYNGVKVALQICSDYAYESLRGLAGEADIQLVPASNYGGTSSFQQAKTLVKADSKGSEVTEKSEKGKEDKKADGTWTLGSVKGAVLSYHYITK